MWVIVVVLAMLVVFLGAVAILIVVGASKLVDAWHAADGASVADEDEEKEDL